MSPHCFHAPARAGSALGLTLRSLIIAPGDDEAKLAAAVKSGADAVVIDLAVAPQARPAARANAARLLAKAQVIAPALMVRVNPLGEAETDRDLDAVMGQAPFAILLPNALAAGVQQLSARLAVREALGDLEDGLTRIVAVADTAAALLGLAGAREMSARLIGLAWDAEGLRADIGAETCRDESGAYAGPYRLARDLALLAATAAGVAAIDAASTDIQDPERFRAEAIAARRDGFAAKLAADPDQAKIINEAFGARRRSGARL
ncbi:MAG: aldolase/citrate lyase family protein [Roseiarcus sp.]